MLGNNEILLTLPFGTNVTALKPTITHTGASVTPGSGVAQDFSSPRQYVVTAQDGSQNTYSVSVRIAVNRTVYAVNSAGKLYALNGTNGTVKWQYSAGGTVASGSPCYQNGTVYFGSSDGYMNAIDASNGALRWRFLSAGSLAHTTPVVSNGVLYFGGQRAGGRGALYALNASSGALVWNNLLPQAPLGNPTVSNGKVFVSYFYGMVSLDAATGASFRSYSTSICGINPLVVNGWVFSGTESTVVSAYNVQTGANAWHYLDVPPGSPSAGASSSPTLHNGVIFNAGYTRYLYAIDSSSGALKWKYILGGGANTGYFSAPVVGNGIVYAGNTDNNVYAIDEQTGALRWRFSDAPNVGGTPNVGGINYCTVKGTMLYVGYSNGKVYALNAVTGGTIWSFDTSAPIYGGICVEENGSVAHPGHSGEQQ
ncbi:PQQ-binding-like beta-propeller repeat protein [Flaviaesturariibacter amylovorans]|uniref:PQQ-binding-like beta-propeller repeat protein n=2 Tax=Flaviaesturariibacter amylovorans TaxID=1084520 RepID=A0ABP8HPW8_9BACT